MDDINATLKRWQLDGKAVRDQMYRAPTPRERERWHAIWLLSQGWTASRAAAALERDAHTIGDWVADLAQRGPRGLAFEQTGGSPPPSPRSSKRR